jgi:hypothetical protein
VCATFICAIFIPYILSVAGNGNENEQCDTSTIKADEESPNPPVPEDDVKKLGDHNVPLEEVMLLLESSGVSCDLGLNSPSTQEDGTSDGEAECADNIL